MSPAGGALSEEDIIARYFAPLATAEGADGLRDDAASFAVGPGEEVVVTQDALAAGVHFFADDPPGAIAAKALRVNLSDLVAKGAEPFGYLLALALEAGVGEDWIAGFSRGLAADQRTYGVSLLGGDTLKAAGGTTIAVTAFGRLPAGRIVRRSGARPGEVLVVTGTLGDASLYLKTRTDTSFAAAGLDDAMRAYLRETYLRPTPPVAAFAAVRRFASAAMDVSDGLLGDLRKLVRASGVGAIVDPAKIPLSAAGKAAVGADADALMRVMSGGDDYQILASLPERSVAGYLEALAPICDAAVIGEVTADPADVFLRQGDALVPVAAAVSYQHF
jgi:thiamine-monophosphate kinase